LNRQARAGPVRCNVNYPRFTKAEGEISWRGIW